MKRSEKPLPELRSMCRHFDLGLPCGVDGKPCTGHKVNVRMQRKTVTIAEYRHQETDDLKWMLCPKLAEALYGKPILPGMLEEAELH